MILTRVFNGGDIDIHFKILVDYLCRKMVKGPLKLKQYGFTNTNIQTLRVQIHTHFLKVNLFFVSYQSPLKLLEMNLSFEAEHCIQN